MLSSAPLFLGKERGRNGRRGRRDKDAIGNRNGRKASARAPRRCANCQMYKSDRFCMGTVEQGYCHLTISRG
jgi:hypothetical protein